MIPSEHEIAQIFDKHYDIHESDGLYSVTLGLSEKAFMEAAQDIIDIMVLRQSLEKNNEQTGN